MQRINTDHDVLEWRRSRQYKKFTNWIKTSSERLAAGNGKGKGKARELLDTQPGSSKYERINGLLQLLDTLQSTITAYPPIHDGTQRFGNRAFKKWWEAEVNENLSSLLPSPADLNASTILPLLLRSHAFGHPIRLDYGSGHELSFALMLFSLVEDGWIFGDATDQEEPIEMKQTEEQKRESAEGGNDQREKVQDELVLRVFPKYLELVTQLQMTYNLEPAGSHGVWGLDDYCFLPYIFGSAQLLGTSITPSEALANAKDPNFVPKDMWTLTLQRLFHFKRGPFHEHSPLLYSLSTTVPNFTKIHSGLLRMYEEEVLGKRVVVQHIWFSDLIWEGTHTKLQLQDSHEPQETQTEPTHRGQQTDNVRSGEATSGSSKNIISERTDRDLWLSPTSTHHPSATMASSSYGAGANEGVGQGATVAPWARAGLGERR